VQRHAQRPPRRRPAGYQPLSAHDFVVISPVTKGI